MHDMGNSNGGMGSYIKLIDKYSQYMGGFIWDFIDQALLVHDPVSGQDVLRYGGDFDDRHSDYEFSGDGLMFADRTPTPAFWRATTDNDRGSGFNQKAAQWLGTDMFTKCVGIHVQADDHQFGELPVAPINNQFSNQEFVHEVKVAFDYETLTTPATKVKIIYNINDAGHMTITMHYFGKKGLPPLPVIGMRFIMPTKAKGFWLYWLVWWNLPWQNGWSRTRNFPHWRLASY